MSTLSVALAHYRRRQALANAVTTAAGRLWQQVDRADIAGSWLRLMPRALAALTAAQRAAAGMAPEYVAQVLREQGLPANVVAVDPNELAGIASDGRDLDTLLMQPAIVTKSALAGGVTLDQALNVGLTSLQLITSTQVQDAGRVADGVAITGQRVQTSYVRMLVGKSCSRCVILAGKTYGWNKGFQRHPHCDCVHVPYQEDVPGDIRTDPMAYFRSLSQREREQTFGKAGTQAIEDGADLNQVVNARRGMTTAGLTQTGTNAEGRTVNIHRRTLVGTTTSEGISRRGFHGGYRVDSDGRLVKRARGEKAPPRLMPEEIYRQAGTDRELAQAMLRENGYIVGSVPIAPARTSAIAAHARPFHRDLDGVGNLATQVEGGLATAERKVIAKGEQAGVKEQLTMSDGTKVFRKEYAHADPDAKHYTDAEQLAGRLGQALGVPVPRVYRIGEREIYTDWAEGTAISSVAKRNAERVAEAMVSVGAKRIGLLDVLTANIDRHRGNMLLDRAGHLTGIDHGLAFTAVESILTETNTIIREAKLLGFMQGPGRDHYVAGLQSFGPNPLTPADVDEIHRRVTALRPQFEHVGRGRWLDFVLHNLELLRPHAAGTRSIFDD